MSEQRSGEIQGTAWLVFEGEQDIIVLGSGLASKADAEAARAWACANDEIDEEFARVMEYDIGLTGLGALTSKDGTVPILEGNDFDVAEAYGVAVFGSGEAASACTIDVFKRGRVYTLAVNSYTPLRCCFESCKSESWRRKRPAATEEFGAECADVWGDEIPGLLRVLSQDGAVAEPACVFYLAPAVASAVRFITLTEFDRVAFGGAPEREVG
jgi:hypothetical protein